MPSATCEDGHVLLNSINPCPVLEGTQCRTYPVEKTSDTCTPFAENGNKHESPSCEAERSCFLRDAAAIEN